MRQGAPKSSSKFLKDSALLRQYLWKYRRWVGIGLIALIIVDGLDVLPPVFLKEVVDVVVEHRPWILLAWIALAYGVTSLVQGFCRYGWRMFLIRSSLFAGRDLRTRYAQHLFGLSLRFFERSRMGELMSLAINDVEAVRVAIGNGLLVFADALIYLLTVPVAMFWLSPKLTLVVCLPLPLIPWIVLRNEKKVHERFEKAQECFGKISSVTQENLNGIRIVKGFAREDTQIKRIRELGQDYLKLNLDLARLQTTVGPSLDFIMSIGMVLLIFVGGKSMIFGEQTAQGASNAQAAITLGTFVAFQKYIQKMIWPMAALGMAVNYYQRSVSSSRRLEAIFSISTEIPEPAKPILPTEFKGKVEFRNLSFRFHGAEELILKDVSLTIEPGERVAFVGEIGSGKSTLLSLLPRLYAVNRGMLWIDGVDINDWPIEELRRQVGYVGQDVFLFNETVFENVAFGLHDWDQQLGISSRTEFATQLASMHEDVVRLKSGYQTRLGERGVNFSGGQKQRLTIARAIAMNPSILVLDDALSSVDVQTEEKILLGLRRRKESNTELIAAHRISTIQDADRIVVLSGGRVTQVGTHGRLVSQSHGDYFKFFEQQRLKEDLESYQNEL